MKKLIITLLALAVLFSLAVPAMAASPVKDYASAADGDLLYTVNFKGDEAYAPDYQASSSIFDITPIENGAGLEVKGNSFNDDGSVKNRGTIWGNKITGLNADATTKYTMTYQIWMDSDDGGANEHGGKNCFIGVAGMYEGTAKKWINFTSNYFTKTAENRAYSIRRNSGVLFKQTDDEKSGVFAETLIPVKDANGYYTVRLTFDGTTATVTAYILTAGTGAKDSDWTKVIDAPYNVEANSSMACAVYMQYTATHAKIKNVNIYKGLVTGVADTGSDDATTGTTGSTTATTGGSSSTEDDNAKTADNFAGIVIAMALLSAGAVVALTTNRKKIF